MSPDSGSDQKICQRKAFNNEAEPGELLKYKHAETGLVVAALKEGDDVNPHGLPPVGAVAVIKQER